MTFNRDEINSLIDKQESIIEEGLAEIEKASNTAVSICRHLIALNDEEEWTHQVEMQVGLDKIIKLMGGKP